MEKQRLIVIKGAEIEEPVSHSGRICDFRDLTVRTVLLDEVYRNPEGNPGRSIVIDIEMKISKNIRRSLEEGKFADVIRIVEKNNHPRLWKILMESSLRRLDLKTAERCFIQTKDYSGLRFLKRVQGIHSESLRRAEVLIFLGELEAAERIYADEDRRDLMLEMWRRMNEWPRVQQILLSSPSAGDDQLLAEAWSHVGDYYAERQQWQLAAKQYEHSPASYAQLAHCCLRMEDFEAMEALAARLPPEEVGVLETLARAFSNYGLCEQAVSCYLKGGKVDEAFNTCIQLNQWDRASELSDRYHLANVQNLLSNAHHHIIGSKTKNLAIVQLYRKAGRYLQAAKIVFEVAANENKQAPALRLKKLYVLGALLVEQYHEQSRQRLAKAKGEAQISTSTLLQGLLIEDESLGAEDTKLLDRRWRGAEAYHFAMLAHKQLYEHQYEAAMKTSLALCNYEDLLDPNEVYSLLALTSCLAGYYGTCSKAFMRLESMASLSEDEQLAYSKLALEIFLKNPPKDEKGVRVECPSCGQMMFDHFLACPNIACNTKFSPCVITGRPLYAFQFWLCPCCKHRAYEEAANSIEFCPLCHADLRE